MHKSFTFLSLGDSYTIGEGVLLHKSFPYQTVQLLRKEGFDFAAPEILAKTGWTTDDLQQGITGYSFLPKYDVVTLLIGVNNQYQQQEIILYKEQLEALVIKAIELAGGKKEHVFLLSIPDYSVTPYAASKNVDVICKEIEDHNKLAKAISIQYKIGFLDITEDSRKAKEKATHLAEDGLHPSAKAYSKWAKKLSDAVAGLLKK